MLNFLNVNRQKQKIKSASVVTDFYIGHKCAVFNSIFDSYFRHLSLYYWPVTVYLVFEILLQ